MLRNCRNVVVALVLLSLLVSCSPSRRQGERKAEKPRREGPVYDEALHRGPPMKELMLLTVMPFVSNVEYIEGITPLERTEGKLFFTLNNTSAYALKDLSVRAVMVIDESAIILPTERISLVVSGSKGEPKRVEGVGNAGQLMEIAPESIALKIGDRFAIDGHGHGQFDVQWTVPTGVRRGEKLFVVVVVGDDAGRRLVVRSDPVIVDLLRKDWGR